MTLIDLAQIANDSVFAEICIVFFNRKVDVRSTVLNSLPTRDVNPVWPMKVPERVTICSVSDPEFWIENMPSITTLFVDHP